MHSVKASPEVSELASCFTTETRWVDRQQSLNGNYAARQGNQWTSLTWYRLTLGKDFCCLCADPNTAHASSTLGINHQIHRAREIPHRSSHQLAVVKERAFTILTINFVTWVWLWNHSSQHFPLEMTDVCFFGWGRGLFCSPTKTTLLYQMHCVLSTY